MSILLSYIKKYININIKIYNIKIRSKINGFLY